MRIVYVTYDGLEDPLGQSQVRPYLEGLSRRGHDFELVSFEKPGVPLRMRERMSNGIRWTALRYHRRPCPRPPSACCGAWGHGAASLLIRADLIHVRSYVAAALALPWAVSARVPLIFDMRGFWPDEKVDGGAWAPGGWLYRSAKAVEKTLLQRASAVVVLTHSMRDYLRHEYPHRSDIHAPIHVIPTCADLARFAPTVAKESAMAAELDGARVLAYLGSLETWYMAETMARFYLTWRSSVREMDGPDVETRFLVISRSDPAPMASIMSQAGAAGELVHRSDGV